MAPTTLAPGSSPLESVCFGDGHNRDRDLSVCVCPPGCSKGESSVGEQLNEGVASIKTYLGKKLLG